MKGDKSIISFLDAGSTTFFNVDKYQRSYVWTKEQCRELYMDILRLKKDKSGLSKHFIGNIITYNNGTNVQIVDGQQRLITITLLLAAIRNTIENSKVLSGNKEYSRLSIAIYGILYSSLKHKCRIKVKSNDSEKYESIIHNKPIPKNKSNLVQAYNYFIKEIKLDSEIDLLQLFDSINRLTFLECCTESQKEANVVFCRLNSTGMKMQSYEEINSFLYEAITRETTVEETISSNTEMVLSIFEMLEDKTNTERNEFFFRFLLCENFYENRSYGRKSPAKTKSYFKEWLNCELSKHGVTVANCLKKIIEFGHYEENPSSQKIINYLIKTSFPNTSIKQLINDILYKYKVNIDEKEFKKILLVYEDIIIRRSFVSRNWHDCNLSDDMVKRTLELMSKMPNLTFYEAFVQTLNTHYISATYSVDDKEFLIAMMGGRKIRSDFSKVILNRIEQYLSGYNEVITFQDIEVDHVLAQSLSNDTYVNCIGNLTLLSSKNNKTASNCGFDKKIEFLQNSLFRLNRYFDGKTSWSKNDIMIRTIELYKIMLEIWGSRYPEVKIKEAIQFANEEIEKIKLK